MITDNFDCVLALTSGMCARETRFCGGAAGRPENQTEMPTKQIAIVTTTIYVPKALRAYMENAKDHNHSDIFIVVRSKNHT